MNIENELKLIPTSDISIEQIIELLREQGIIALNKEERIHQEDTYFDDKNGTLEKAGGSFRIRRKNGITITYKMPIESDAEYKQRKEYEIGVSQEYGQNMNMQLAINILKEHYPELVLPRDMEKILTVVNDRDKVNLTCSDGTSLEMTFDTLQGVDEKGNIYPIQPEIEFEIISGNPENLTKIYEAIIKVFPEQIAKNTLSKYARTKKEKNKFNNSSKTDNFPSIDER